MMKNCVEEIVFVEQVDAVYIAYQGDVGDFQSMYVVGEPPESAFGGDKEARRSLIEGHIRSTMAACLHGWWSAKSDNINPQLAQLAGIGGEFIAAPHGFCVRATRDGWSLFMIEYTSDSLSEAVISLIETGIGEPPVGVPDFVSFSKKSN